MNIFYIVSGLALAAGFFLNIKSAADVLCRIIGGFAVLILYNTCAPIFSFSPVGINLVSSAITGILGIPGWLLLLCCNYFL